MDLVLNNLQRLICHKTQQTNQTINPSVPIIHRSRQVFQTTSCVRTELLLVSSRRSFNTGTSMYLGPWKNVTYEFTFDSHCPACLVCLTWMILEMGGKWSYSCSFVGCCLFSMNSDRVHNSLLVTNFTNWLEGRVSDFLIYYIGSCICIYPSITRPIF